LATPIGVFDSGFGGLTILREIVRVLPDYDYLYLGDTARSPYGPRSFETVYDYTLQCVRYLFGRGCPLVILACNTASAKALRNIQQLDLPQMAPDRRVLGVIRPTTEIIGTCSASGHIGILATVGTVASESYLTEISKFFPALHVTQEACPMWVPLVETGEYDRPGADYFVRQHLDRILTQDPQIDTLLLACTHYPLLEAKIRQFVPPGIRLVGQGQIVARSLTDYLTRHPDMAARCSRAGQRAFLTTDTARSFERQASVFFGEPSRAEQVTVND
jgi:glutamate racemase